MRIEEVVLSKPGEGRQNVVTFDETELRVRLFEAMIEKHRPAGQSAKEAWATIREVEPAMADALMRQSAVAMDYVIEAMRNAEPEALQ